MGIKIAATVLALLPLPSLAQNMHCMSQGYCDDSLTCSPDDEGFDLTYRTDGTVDFGWVGSTVFNAKPLARNGFTYFPSTSGPDAVQLLVVGDDLRATLTVAFAIGAVLHSSLQVLICEVAP